MSSPLLRPVHRCFVVAVFLAALFSIAVVPAALAAEYAIQPEDVLSVQVSGEPGLSKNYTVDEKGAIAMERVGKLPIAGLTARQAQEKITTELKKYLKLFEVTVFVVGETGGRILVYGEVNKQGPIKLRVGGKLLDVLAEAGGPTANADTRRVSIARKAEGRSETVDLEVLLKDPSKDVKVEAGDTITVPSKALHTVRIDGEVRTPGSKSLEDYKTAFAAIQSAGPTEKADWKRIALRRKGSSIPLMLDLSQVRTGQLKDDLELQEGDQITVMSKFSGLATIRGEVKNPGEKELNGSTQLWDFIATSGGGFGDRADKRRVQIIRINENEDGKEVRTVDLTAVADGTARSDDPQYDVLPGDLIFIPIGTAILRGEVKTPGEKPIGNTSQLWDFIMQAGGGFTDVADRTKVQILRDGKVVQTVNLLEAAQGESAPDQASFEVLPGDVVQVPNDTKNRFAIVGGVKKSGTYPVKPGMTLLDAITQAEGFSDRATKKQFVIAPADRFGPDGKLKAPPAAEGGKKGRKGKVSDDPSELGLVVIDYKKLIRGDPTQNIAIHPGDRILIPEEPPADQRGQRPSFLQSILRMVPLVGSFMVPGLGALGGLGGFGGFGGGYY